MAALNVTDAKTQNTAEEKSSRRWVFIAILALLIGAILAGAWRISKSAEEDAERNITRDMQNFVFARATELNSWFAQVEDKSKAITDSVQFKYFAEEADKAGDNIVVMLKPSDSQTQSSTQQNNQQDDPLNTQLMRVYLIDGIAANDFTSGRMVNRKGATYLATENIPAPLNEAQIEIVNNIIKSGKKSFSPIYQSPNGLMIDMYLPIFPMQYTDNAATPANVSNPVAVLILSKRITDPITRLINTEYPVKGISSMHLLQKVGNTFQDILLTGAINKIRDRVLDAQNNMPFSMGDSLDQSGTKVYSYGLRLTSLDWWVVQEINYDRARTQLNIGIRNIYIYAGLGSLVLVLAFIGMWWWFAGHQQKQVLGQFQELFAVIDEQKRLLDGINSTISDPISLTDAKGVYRYVNRAFATAVGRDAHEIPGLDTAAVFGFDTAKRLNASDQHVMMTADALTTNEIIWLQSRKHYFQISKTPLREAGTRTPVGIVSVFHDLTQIMETEEHSRRVVQQTINALVQAIEEADPFLGGHSRIMGGIATLIAKTMQLSDAEVATIQAAANLSQIGKMYIPREILTKPGTLSEDEKKTMEQHIEHTKDIVSGIEFDLPVGDAIYQMHERLDGKGYPKGLADKDINIYARVLAVANAFTAMARPRSYRPALGVDDVLSSLENQKSSYDQRIVAVLREVLQTPAGERYVHMAANSKAL